MPESVTFLPHRQILTFEEIERVVRIVAVTGVSRVRITGGEPLVRSELHKLVSLIRRIDGIEDIAMTTNAILLEDQAQRLKDSGLNRINVSLDTLNPQRFEQIARRKGLEKVLRGIEMAQRVGFEDIRINTVALAGITETEIVPLAQFARSNNLTLRFIEFMPLDGDQSWQDDQVITGDSIRDIIRSHVCSLTAIESAVQSQPAIDYQYDDGRGRVGFINSVSSPFCSACDRLRITADGRMRNCLFGTEEWNLIPPLRNGGTDGDILDLIRLGIQRKKAGHGTDDVQFQRPQRAMYQIGG
jgi:cyclic pyranopterin phosphate synthase